jgi:hypothetical protein
LTSAIYWIKRLACLLALVAGIFSVVQYPGNKIVFSLFCLAIFATAALAVRFPKQYAHFFLSIAWFVGFWVKYVFHQVTGSSYYEPHGRFDGLDASWDAVFLVVGVGVAGYLAGRLIALPIIAPATDSLSKRTINVPVWWPLYRNLFWVAAGILILAILVANQEFGLLVRGYVAKYILPWPLGGLFAWITDIGLALLLALFLAWDRQAGFGIILGFVALCVEGALLSVSTLSRGVYFFHTVPPLVTEGVEGSVDKRRWLPLLLVAVWIAVGVTIPSTTTALRLIGHDALPVTQSELVASQSGHFSRNVDEYDFGVFWQQFVTMSQLLLIDRWTGLEGVMASVSYPGKSWSLLAEAAAQRRSYGTVDVYTRKISGSTFNEEDAKTYHFASLAGPIAFFYFSGSLGVVFAGMTFLSVLISATELFWRWLVRDRVLVAMSGLYLALVVMQFSGGVVQSMTSLTAVTLVFVAVWAIGSHQNRHLMFSTFLSRQKS